MQISVVSPVYKAPEILPELVARLEKSLNEITDSYEVILVDDGCPWNSWDVIVELAKKYSFVRGIKLSRNFGQHHAITAGLDHVQGEWVVVMDCDLQDRPEEIYKLYTTAQVGYDIIFARRKNRQDSKRKKITSYLFYLVFHLLSGVKYDGTVGNFGIYKYKVIQSINKIREPMRSFPAIAKWVGYNVHYLDVQHSSRLDGKTSYTWTKLLQLALSVIIAYSNRPLKLVILTGFFISLISSFYGIYNFMLYYKGLISVSGYPSIIISLWFLGGLIIFTMGVLGLYIEKIFEGIKARPLYIIDKKTS